MEADPKVTPRGGEKKEEAVQQVLICLDFREITKHLEWSYPNRGAREPGCFSMSPLLLPWRRTAGWAFSLPHVPLAARTVPVAELQLVVTAAFAVLP